MGKPGKYNERPIEYEFLFKNLQHTNGPMLLDIGPGDSGMYWPLKHCGFGVKSIDPMPIHKHTDKGDVRKLKYKDGTFDVVTCISTVEHIKQAGKAVVEMLRVLKPGGLLIISFPYNPKKHIPNVYNPDYLVTVFNDADIKKWFDGKAEEADKIYWKQWSGQYWRSGKREIRAYRTDKEGAQGICLALVKS